MHLGVRWRTSAVLVSGIAAWYSKPSPVLTTLKEKPFLLGYLCSTYSTMCPSSPRIQPPGKTTTPPGGMPCSTASKRRQPVAEWQRKRKQRQRRSPSHLHLRNDVHDRMVQDLVIARAGTATPAAAVLAHNTLGAQDQPAAKAQGVGGRRAHNPRRSGPLDAQGARCATIRGDQGHRVGG